MHTEFTPARVIPNNKPDPLSRIPPARAYTLLPQLPQPLAFQIRTAYSVQDLANILPPYSAYVSSLHAHNARTFRDGTEVELSQLANLHKFPTGTLQIATSSNDNSIIGFAAVQPCTKSGRTRSERSKMCELSMLYCVPSARRLGVGTALLQSAADAARTLHYETIRVCISAYMVEAESLFTDLGFEDLVVDDACPGELNMVTRISLLGLYAFAGMAQVPTTWTRSGNLGTPSDSLAAMEKMRIVKSLGFVSGRISIQQQLDMFGYQKRRAMKGTIR